MYIAKTSADLIEQNTVKHRDTNVKFHRVIKQNTRKLKTPPPQKCGLFTQTSLKNQFVLAYEWSEQQAEFITTERDRVY